MKKFIIPFLFLSLAACRNESANSLKVKGRLLNNPEKQTVYLDIVELEGPSPRTLDTAILQPGSAAFSLNGIASEGEGIYRLRFEKDGAFVLLVNDRNDIEFSGNWNSFGSYTTNSASSNSFRTLLNAFNDRLAIIDTMRKGMMTARNNNENDSLIKVRENDLRLYITGTEDYLLKYADTTNSASIALYIVGPILRTQLEQSRFEPVMTSMSKRFGNHPVVQKVVKEYFDYMQKQQDISLMGKPAPEIRLPDLQGKLVNLSSFRGKYVLVDFWASWCAPCRRENPNIVQVYNQFKDKNFAILGVSLDRDKGPWLKAIHDDGLDWTQISDLKYWESAVVPIYHIEGIPFNVLVDPQGNVIASKLYGPDLQRKLTEVLK